jgi:secreted PhoX family phosphatase
MGDTDDIGSNLSGNPHLGDMILDRVNRRQVIAGGLAAAAVGIFGRSIFAANPVAAATAPASAAAGRLVRQNPRLLGFAPVGTSAADAVLVPEGYVAEVLVPWGTPLFDDSPAWLPDASNTAADQAMQVGFNHDGIHFFPFGNGAAGSRNGLLVLNHEYTDANQIYAAAQGSAITNDDAGREKVAKALAGHGVTVVEVQQMDDGTWQHVQGSPFNRRITGTTPMAFSGPVAASHPMLQSAITPNPVGTLNNCGHGFTPWGTYLAAEENWNGYFGTDDGTWAATRTPLEARYGVTAGGFGYNWHRADPRFDVAANRNELNHFGWIVEIDPNDPASTPVKRTALGRFKHEGATVTEVNGRVVVYSGDDENGDYLYKFVGNAPWRQLRARGKSPLDEGTLYVAKFNDDGSGTWLPLVHGVGLLTVANGFLDQADVIIRTRMAADAVGATRLHRPEWVGVNSKTGDVFVTLTNGSGNPSAANSGRNPNPYGHIVRFHEVGPVSRPTEFAWDVFLFAGDPAYPALAGPNVPADQPIFGSPDGIWVDDDGLVWIQTDISNSAQNLASNPTTGAPVGYDNIGNNQMLVANPDTGEVKRFLTGPRGCEVTGVITTPDQRTMFVNIQHPGESTTFWNLQFGAPSTGNPRTVSNWPDQQPDGRPRSSTVVIRKLDGGKIGT